CISTGDTEKLNHRVTETLQPHHIMSPVLMQTELLADLALVVAWVVAYGAFLLAMIRYQRARGIERVRRASYRSYPALILWHGASLVLFACTLVLIVGPQVGFCVGDVHPLCR
ncbi:MAG: hypothetical protein AAFN13_09695, partial [Bacteroidota bacterium]